MSKLSGRTAWQRVPDGRSGLNERRFSAKVFRVFLGDFEQPTCCLTEEISFEFGFETLQGGCRSSQVGRHGSEF